MKLEITLQQIQQLLDEQKRLTIEKLRGNSGYYNKETTSSVHKTLPIDEKKFVETGMSSKYPDDFNVLKRYIN